MKLKEEAIDYSDGDAELSGLLVWDDNDLARPGIVVVHGGAGWTITPRAARGSSPNSDSSCSPVTCTARA